MSESTQCTSRPARVPPACRLVRPWKTIMRTHRVLFKLRDRVLTIGCLLLKMNDVGINPMHQSSRPRAAGLQAGAAMEDNHEVAAQGLGLLRLADAQALAGGDHQ